MVTQIIDSMCLPALQRWVHYHCYVSWDKMISLTRHSSSHLKEFKINGGPDAYLNIPNFLHHLPSLEVLHLQFWFSSRQPPSRELLHFLCDSMEEYLPHLQYLEFGSSFPFSWETIPRIFASPHRRSLKMKVDYEFHRCPANITDEDAERLLELVEKGFDLSIFQDGQDVLEKEETGAQPIDIPSHVIHCEEVVKSGPFCCPKELGRIKRDKLFVGLGLLEL